MFNLRKMNTNFLEGYFEYCRLLKANDHKKNKKCLVGLFLVLSIGRYLSIVYPNMLLNCVLNLKNGLMIDKNK